MLLEDKVAVIYGAAGSVGRTVAPMFAQEGARVFLAGRTQQSFDQVPAGIRSPGCSRPTRSSRC